MMNEIISNLEEEKSKKIYKKKNIRQDTSFCINIIFAE